MFRSLTSTRIRCDMPSWVWPVWLLAVDGKEPVKGLTQAREPMLFWSPFRPDSVQDRSNPGKDGCLSGNHWCYKAANAYLPMPQKACFSQDWPICSKRSVLSVPPLIR